MRLLKKSKLTLEYTFYNIGGKSNRTVMSIDDLREDGIGDILIDMGRMTEDEEEKILKKLDPDEYDEYGEDW